MIYWNFVSSFVYVLLQRTLTNILGSLVDNIAVYIIVRSFNRRSFQALL